MEDIKEKQNQKIRQIIRENAMHVDWNIDCCSIYSGDDISFEIAGESVFARVWFDSYGIEMHMYSPIDCTCKKDVFYRRQSPFHRNPPGATLFENGQDSPANQKCIEVVKDTLIGLYSDYYLLKCRRDIIRQKKEEFPAFETRFREMERKRVEPLKKRFRELSIQSRDLKRQFKDGKFKQKEYTDRRNDIHCQMYKLTEEASTKDPFNVYFSEEISLCKYISDKRSAIEYI